MRKLCMLLSALLLLCLAAAPAWAQTEGNFAYSVSGGKAKITAYTGSASDLTLPDTLGGYPVSAIGYCAFRNCKTLQRVVIPEGVVSIGSNAFQFCTALTQLTLPQSIRRIDTHAFYACSSLSQIALPGSIERIHSLAFYGCSASRVCSPDSLTAFVLSDVGSSFTHPDYPQLTLRAREDASGLRTFAVIDCAEDAVSVDFPDGVALIDGSAFFGCAALTEIVLPESVTEIAHSAFEGCAALRQITIPGSVKRIDGSAFSGCRNVTIVSPAGSAGQEFARAHADDGFAWQPL